MSTVLTGYAALFKNEDGTFSFGSHVHSTELCAIASISVLEGREFYGVVPVTADFDPNIERPIGMRVVLDHAEEIKELHRKIAEGYTKGFASVVNEINGACPGK